MSDNVQPIGEGSRLASLDARTTVELLGAALDATHDSVIITDAQLQYPGPRVLYVNPAFTRMTGYRPADILGRTPRVLQGPETDPALLAELRRCMERGQVFIGRTVNYKADGVPFYIEWRISPITDSAGQVAYYIAIQRDVSGQERALEDPNAGVELDPLTGIHARHALEAALGREVERAKRYGFPLSLILFDLDRLKSFNLAHGYDVGDWALQRLTERIGRRLRASDVFGRWGDDEFLVLLPHVGGASARNVAQAIAWYVGNPATPRELSGTASIGLAEISGGDNADDLLGRAEARMYRAQLRGGNRCEVT